MFGDGLKIYNRERKKDKWLRWKGGFWLVEVEEFERRNYIQKWCTNNWLSMGSLMS